MNDLQTANTAPPSETELTEIRQLSNQDAHKIKETYFPGEEDYSFWTIRKQLGGQRTLKQRVLEAARKYLDIQRRKDELERSLLQA